MSNYALIFRFCIRLMTIIPIAAGALERTPPPSAVQDCPQLLETVEVIAGELSVSVYAHELVTRDGKLSLWTYVSKGMKKQGQREIVFTLRRTQELEKQGFPRVLFTMFRLIYGLAKEGKLVEDGGVTVWSPSMLFLGRPGPWGLMYLPAERFEGLEVPADALTAILIRDYETELVAGGLYYRVATSLTGTTRYFPYPPWSDLDRKAVITPAQMEKSILGKVKLFSLKDAMVQAPFAFKVLSKASAPPGISGEGTLLGDLVLRIRPEAVPELQAFLTKVPEDGMMALLTAPDPDVHSRLWWSADTGETMGLNHPSGPGESTTGGFLLLGHGATIKNKISIVEDGFAAILSTGGWEKLKSAVDSRSPAKISAADGQSALSLEFLPAGSTQVETIKVVDTSLGELAGAQAFAMRYMFIYEALMAESGLGPGDVAAYISKLIGAANAALAGFKKQEGRGLLIAVGVKPGKKVKVWCDAVGGSLALETLQLLEAELEKVPTLVVRNKSFGFVLNGTLWGSTVKEFPQFPAAWLEVIRSRKGVADFDALFKRVWPD